MNVKRTIARVAGHVARRVYPLGSRSGLAHAFHQRLVRHFSYSRKPLRVRYDDVSFEVMLGDNLQRHLFFCGSYEPELHEMLKQELLGGGVLVDVGANIGVHGLPVARMFQRIGAGHVYAFEAAPDTAERLRQLAERNGVASCLEVIQVALGDRPRTATLRSATEHASLDVGMRSLYGSGEDAIPVQVTTFDAWAVGARLERWDVLKMDVEGAETEVLRGMQRTLARLRPRLLAIEVVEEHLQRAGSSRAELLELLAAAGYRELPPTERIHGIPAAVMAPNLLFRPTAS